jgi:hypothetical protein
VAQTRKRRVEPAKDERLEHLVDEGMAALRAAAVRKLTFEEIQGAIGTVLADVMRKLREEDAAGISSEGATVEEFDAEDNAPRAAREEASTPKEAGVRRSRRSRPSAR